jgi:ATP-binding cassette subfamily F protein uup
LDLQKSVLKNICSDGDYVSLQGQYVFARSYLERFLFSRQQMDLPVGRLSGGEQSRLRLAQLMLQDASVLILDEPTNDLDVATLEVLGDAIQNFNGAVIIVTHDRYFMDQVASDILSFPRRDNPNKKLENFVGYLQWEEAWFAQDHETEAAMAPAAQIIETKPVVKASRMSFKHKNELEGMEPNILAMEDELTKVQAEASSPEVVSKASRVQELHVKIAKLQADIEIAYARWTELEKMAKGESAGE